MLYFGLNWLHGSKDNHRCTLDVLLVNGNKKVHKTLRFSFLVDKQLGNYFLSFLVVSFFSKSKFPEEKGDLSAWKIFTYLDVSTPGEATLHWQKPVKYSPERFIVTAESNLKNETHNLTSYSHKFELSPRSNWYNFKVKPVGNVCGTGCQEGELKIIIGINLI